LCGDLHNAFAVAADECEQRGAFVAITSLDLLALMNHGVWGKKELDYSIFAWDGRYVHR
jgi:hypothetical protein